MNQWHIRLLRVTKFLPMYCYSQLQPPEVLIQPKKVEARNIDYWDPTLEAQILKAVSIITFANEEKEV